MMVSSYDIGLIEKVKEFINADLRTHHPVTELALVAGMGQTRLKELFRLHIGSSLYAYLRSRRMEVAADKLINSEQNLKTIARDCGYRQYNNFAKAFKSCYGLTPRRYRNLHDPA